MAEPRILRIDEIPTIDRGGGSVARRLVGPWLGAKGLTSGLTTIPAGRAIALHHHNVEEMVTLLEGEAACDVEGQRHQLKLWDTTYIPAGVAHRFANTGQVPMTILYAYAGAHVTRTLAETGKTAESGAPDDVSWQLALASAVAPDMRSL